MCLELKEKGLLAKPTHGKMARQGARADWQTGHALRPACPLPEGRGTLFSMPILSSIVDLTTTRPFPIHALRRAAGVGGGSRFCFCVQCLAVAFVRLILFGGGQVSINGLPLAFEQPCPWVGGENA